MDVTEVLNKARDAITVSRVYGEPYEKDGLTVIPPPLTRAAGTVSYTHLTLPTILLV